MHIRVVNTELMYLNSPMKYENGKKNSLGATIPLLETLKRTLAFLGDYYIKDNTFYSLISMVMIVRSQ